MLILTRRVGETVMIGNDVTVTVLGVKGNQVRIGINAPKNVAVHREEIFERIKREQQGEPQGETKPTAEYVSAYIRAASPAPARLSRATPKRLFPLRSLVSPLAPRRFTSALSAARLPFPGCSII